MSESQYSIFVTSPPNSQLRSNRGYSTDYPQYGKAVEICKPRIKSAGNLKSVLSDIGNVQRMDAEMRHGNEVLASHSNKRLLSNFHTPQFLACSSLIQSKETPKRSVKLTVKKLQFNIFVEDYSEQCATTATTLSSTSLEATNSSKYENVSICENENTNESDTEKNIYDWISSYNSFEDDDGKEGPWLPQKFFNISEEHWRYGTPSKAASSVRQVSPILLSAVSFSLEASPLNITTPPSPLAIPINFL